MENDFFKPTHPTKVWKIPYFFFEPFPKIIYFATKFRFFLGVSSLKLQVFVVS